MQALQFSRFDRIIQLQNQGKLIIFQNAAGEEQHSFLPRNSLHLKKLISMRYGSREITLKMRRTYHADLIVRKAVDPNGLPAALLTPDTDKRRQIRNSSLAGDVTQPLTSNSVRIPNFRADLITSTANESLHMFGKTIQRGFKCRITASIPSL